MQFLIAQWFHWLQLFFSRKAVADSLQYMCDRGFSRWDPKYLVLTRIPLKRVVVFQTLLIKDCTGELIPHKDDFRGLNLRELKIIHCAMAEPPYLSHIKNTLHLLRLSGNNISKIPNNYFEGCMRLEMVYLTENELIAVPYLGFIRQSVLILDLSANKIQNISWLYDSLPVVQSVSLEFNLITEICMSFHFNWPRLTNLDLGNNNLTSFYLPPDRGWIIYLVGDPFHCDERLSWTRRCHRTEAEDYFTCGHLFVDYVFHMRCVSPSQWYGFKPIDAGNSMVHTSGPFY